MISWIVVSSCSRILDGIFSFDGGGDNWGDIEWRWYDNTQRQQCISCGGVGCIYVLHNMVVLWDYAYYVLYVSSQFLVRSKVRCLFLVSSYRELILNLDRKVRRPCSWYDSSSHFILLIHDILPSRSWYHRIGRELVLSFEFTISFLPFVSGKALSFSDIWKPLSHHNILLTTNWLLCGC